jgi:hypothetical protein
MSTTGRRERQVNSRIPEPRSRAPANETTMRATSSSAARRPRCAGSSRSLCHAALLQDRPGDPADRRRRNRSLPGVVVGKNGVRVRVDADSTGLAQQPLGIVEHAILEGRVTGAHARQAMPGNRVAHG